MLESVVTVGGPAVILGYIIVHILRMYRKDRMFMEDRLSGLLEKDQSSREESTKALTKMITLLEKINRRQ